ncbi:hypothetical protein D3C87_1954910 [compost metagenome]
MAARRKLKVVKIKSNITAPAASPASSVACPMRPTTAVSTRPSSGVVRKPSVIGSAIARTRRCVTWKGPVVSVGEAEEAAVIERSPA